MPILLYNKKAKFEYEILDSYQAGLSLSGKMVKMLRGRRVNILGKYVVYQNGHLEIIGLGNEEFSENVPLLLKQKEIDKLRVKLQEKRITCIVLSIKTVGRWLKADIALVRGKKKYDKRETIKQRDLDREMGRDLKRGSG